MRPLRMIAVLAALVTAAATPGVAAAEPLTGHDPGVLARVHTAGRVEAGPNSVTYSWPGVYFEGRFRGTGIGIVLNDAAADYDIQIDGTTVTTLVTPGQTTHWVNGLAKGVHSVRVVKRSESPWATSEFGGFVAAPHGAILRGPRARHRQIEFIGDSYTAGYGNLSATRDCTGDDVNRTTNADISFGAIAARRLNADYQINAYSGRGMVRNYNGSDPQVNYRTFYDRALLSVEGDVWKNPGTWRPQLVVIGLGINDFSTAINPGEPWTPESLVAAYRTAYHAFLDKLRARYGRDTIIVVSATYMSNTTVYAETARQIVQERNSRGDERVRFWYYPETGLDYGGCHWHPSAHDHQIIADRLGEFVATLPLRW
ncbi:SGNH/GDSL hydrolase family protein [Nonomuraea sp. NPDC050786]|uniref:SGNH/GDSL hydrolase family protein n=1 Tax=Nonomuraea sp. NPDC050786 TaxID=3154840 RepID=UPI0033E13CE2